MTPKTKMMCLWLLGLIAALAGVAQAAQIAYDGIQYPPGALNGNVPPPTSGLSGPWIADPGVTVVGGTLASPLALPSMGGAVAGSFNFQVALSSTIAPSPLGREFWASFLIFQGAPNDETFMGLSPAGSAPGAPPSVALGVLLGQYGMFVGGAFTPTAITPSAAPDLLVAHFTAGAATWHVEFFVNPSSFAVPLLAMNVAPVIYGTMVNLNETGYESDEFRLGDTAADVSAAGATPTGPSTWGRLKALYR